MGVPKQARNVGMVFILVLSGLAPMHPLQAQTPVFLGEDLVFHLNDSLCVMRGEYHFLNPSMTPLKPRLFYPFPVSKSLPFPDEVNVISLETGALLPLLGSKNGVSFILEIEDQSEASIQVEYWQSAKSQAFKYILTSTQSWGRALEWANYEIHVPDHLQLEYCSLDIDTSWAEIEKTVYAVSREQFLPTQDFEIKWGQKK